MLPPKSPLMPSSPPVSDTSKVPLLRLTLPVNVLRPDSVKVLALVSLTREPLPLMTPLKI